MARVQKKNNVSEKVTVKPESSGVTGIKEESEKGELFFKIVLIVMAVALVGVIIYFVVDALLGDGDSNTEKRYDKNNYLTVATVNEILSGNGNDSVESLSRSFFEALENEDFTYVYVLFFNEAATDDSSDATRQEAALLIVDEIFDTFGTEVKYNAGEDDEYSYVVIGTTTAIFFVDTSLPENSTTWIDLVPDDAFNANIVVPVLLQIETGNDNAAAWFAPSGPTAQRATTQLQTVLDELEAE